MAFIGSLVPSISSSFRGTHLSAKCKNEPQSANWTMQQTKSPSVPFMNKPPALEETMPGYAGFDPFYISSYLNVKWLQEAEIKHGRISMLAVLGAIIPEFFTFPFYDGPHLFTRGHDWGVHNGSLSQVLFFTSIFEIMTTPAIIQMVRGQSDRTPGYFGFDPLNLGKDPKMATREVKNGRLAMLAISGMIHHAAITGDGVVGQITKGHVVPNIPSF
eukprot:Plantae.Rhodophyta-Hildenbrandia_rubra.ctg2423.p1 GENE.Plantae.Rhodophyta-Hildenbrandia_rubra.ctg2423~~Plantae.Rhodophyta-Hildenbrandia_rubra.ctg2423.p1  ORF type:complete len:245 (+),score=25.70 Plantae.Rhodophyta-Hildenbrandia_rubra.ctg2423:88-735(+)